MTGIKDIRFFADYIPESEKAKLSEDITCIYFIVSSVPMDTFDNRIEETIVQFSIFSGGGLEKTARAYKGINGLFDDRTLSYEAFDVTLKRKGLSTSIDGGIRQWNIEYIATTVRVNQ